MTLFSGNFCHCFGDDMSKNPNGAKEQAKRNRMPSFNLILQSILENMPGFRSEKITQEWENNSKWNSGEVENKRKKNAGPCSKKINNQKVNPGRG